MHSWRNWQRPSVDEKIPHFPASSHLKTKIKKEEERKQKNALEFRASFGLFTLAFNHGHGAAPAMLHRGELDALQDKLRAAKRSHESLPMRN